MHQQTTQYTRLLVMKTTNSLDLENFARGLLILLFVFIYRPSFANEVKNELIKGKIENKTINVDGIERNYKVYSPIQIDNQLSPLIFLLHGNGGSASQLIGINGTVAPFKRWLKIAEQNRLILALPEGTKGINNKQGWNDCREDAITNPGTDDTQFISTLIKTISLNYPVDHNRVFISGISNGGHMALRIALEIPEQINAVAAIAASIPKNSECLPARLPISVLFMNGTLDPIMPYYGGSILSKNSERGSVLATEHSVYYWIKNNKIKTPGKIDFLNLDSKNQSRKNLAINN